MKESDSEEYKTIKPEFLDGGLLTDLGRSRRRSLSNSKAGRGLFLGLLSVLCILLFSSRLLYSFTSIWSGDPSKLVDFAIVGKYENAKSLKFSNEERLRPDETILKLLGNATNGNTLEDDEVVELPRADDKLRFNDEPNRESDEETHREDEDEGSEEKRTTSDAIAFLEQLSLRLTTTGEQVDNGPYHNRRVFESDYAEMKRNIKVYVYPYKSADPYVNIYKPIDKEPSGNYASEEFFQQALQKSGFVTTKPSEANFFFMPISITKARLDKRINVEGLKDFCASYVSNLRTQWQHWNYSGGADHFYLSCHSIARSAMDYVPYVRENAIQILCPSSYYLANYITHKDASVPQIWPRPPIDPKESSDLHPGGTKQRTILAFFAGATNSPVRQELLKHWADDDKIMVHKGRVPYPYSQALMTSKFCLQAKGFEVNTARLGDAMFYGCVPVVIANYYDLPYQDILDWRKFSIVVAHDDIPLLKNILEAVTDEEYVEYHKQVMLARSHFQWHAPAREYDAFYTIMYELWKRRHIVRRGDFGH